MSDTEPGAADLTPRVEEWRRRGAAEGFRGRRIHTMWRDGTDPVILLLHGFPSSSYDWRELLAEETGRAALALDFLGFGLSEKPRDHDYSLLWQADLVAELARRRAPGRPLFVCAHDMGTSVATELMAREIAGELDLDVRGALLFNGSMIQGAASPTLAQRLLRGPLGPLAARLMSERAFRQQFGSIFSEAHPLNEEEAVDQWALIRAGGGDRLGHRLISYMDERERRAERWLGAFAAWPRPLSLVWGMADPVATPRVLAGLRELRPTAPVEEWQGIGHYPQIEVPGRLAAALEAAARASL